MTVSVLQAEPRTSRARHTTPAREPAVATFLARFVRFGASPSVETYMPLFHREIRLFDDGMESPIGYDEIPDSISATLALAQGFVMVPERWRTRDGVVFVEARNQATILGTSFHWQSVYRVVLDGDLVRDGRRYYDRAPLLAALDPTAPALPSLAPEEGAVAPSAALPCRAPGIASAAELVALCAAAWRERAARPLAALFRDDAVLHAPGLARPVGRAEVAGHRARLGALLGGACPRVRAWAGDQTLVTIEWEVDVPTPSGATYALGMVDRFDLAGGRILAARTYFDAAALARALASDRA